MPIMKFPGIVHQLVWSLLCLSGFSEAFATPGNLVALAERDGLTLDEVLTGLSVLKEKRVVFDATVNPIQVDGVHEFKPPDFGRGDQRGPCPGLNALANHGYLPRSGIAGYLEVVEAVNSVYGMGLDLANIIAAMGTVGTGNPLALKPGFSIGGQDPRSTNLLGNLLGLLGTPRGLEGSHNFIEADSSNTRDDLYVTGDASTMNFTLFMDVYNSINNALSMEDIGDRAAQRLDESIRTNPLFYYGPYTGLIVRNAGFAFGARLLSNHSDEFPRGGNLDRVSFKSFWGVSESEDGTLKYNRGWERIPENWYRLRGDYTLVDLNLDLRAWIYKHPQLANIGGNLGQINSFAGIDFDDLTGGVINAVSLLEGNNLVCFVLEIVKSFAPNSLSTLFATLDKPLGLINDALLDPLLDLDCPPMHELQEGGNDIFSQLLERYPGAKRSGFAF